MHQVNDPTTREKVAGEVQAALDRHQPKSYRIIVNHDAIMEDEDWYQIVVMTENDVRDREFYFALSEAEDELQDQNGHQYLLVPAIEE